MPIQNENLLTVKKVDLSLVHYNEQKFLSLIVVLKEDEVFSRFEDKVNLFDHFVITNVRTVSASSDKMKVLFRNVNNQEVLALAKDKKISSLAFWEYYGEFLNSLIVEESEYKGFLLNLLFPGNLDMVNTRFSEFPVELLDDRFDDVVAALETVLKYVSVEEFNDQTAYSMKLPLKYSQLGKVLSGSLDVPGFLLMSESDYKAKLEAKEVLDFNDFSLVSFPSEESVENSIIDAKFSIHTENDYVFDLPKTVANTYLSEILSLTVNIAAGSEEALAKLFTYMNKITKGVNAYENKMKNPAADFSLEDFRMFWLDTAIGSLYNTFSPAFIATMLELADQGGDNVSGFSDLNDVNKYYNDATVIDDLFNDENLQEMFTTILADKSLREISESSSVEEIIEYYTTELSSVESFPEEMQSLVSKIDLPILYEASLMKHVTTDTSVGNPGSVAVAKIILQAIKFNRLKKISLMTNAQISPVHIIIQGILTLVEEKPFWWVASESIRNLPLNGGKLLFRELFTIPESEDISTLSTPTQHMLNILIYLLDRLGHYIENNFDEDTVDSLNINDVYLGALVENWFSKESFLMEEDEEGSCHIVKSIMSTVNDILPLGDRLVSFVDAIGDLALTIADMNAQNFFHSNNLNVVKGSPEWNNYVNELLVEIVTVGKD